MMLPQNWSIINEHLRNRDTRPSLVWQNNFLYFFTWAQKCAQCVKSLKNSALFIMLAASHSERSDHLLTAWVFSSTNCSLN